MDTFPNELLSLSHIVSRSSIEATRVRVRVRASVVTKVRVRVRVSVALKVRVRRLNY